ncbi:MAG TPA: type II toxin-antitoxin system VapC family toxin [Rhizomicrobium sp.]|nr:type II toxin-antitoxin system VapC family toxin [Rhizomicrobium sp.]
MTKIVIDSSALMAYINQEPGGEAVGEILAHATICSVNACEVVTKLVAAGWPVQSARRALNKAGCEIWDFDLDLAFDAGGMVALTRSRGLSLGDRACLALAARLDVPALTADRAWKYVDVGVAVQFIR